MWETQVQSLGQEDPLEKGMATHSSIHAWRIPWMEEPDRLLFMTSDLLGWSPICGDNLFSSIQSLSCVWLFVTPWTATHQASLSITSSHSLLKLHQNWLRHAKWGSSASIRGRDSEIQSFWHPSPSPLRPDWVSVASQGSFPVLFCFSSRASEAGHSPPPRFSFAAETGRWSFLSSNPAGGSDWGQYMKISYCCGRSCECAD